jgi:hypothetical protein
MKFWDERWFDPPPGFNARWLGEPLFPAIKLARNLYLLMAIGAWALLFFACFLAVWLRTHANLPCDRLRYSSEPPIGAAVFGYLLSSDSSTRSLRSSLILRSATLSLSSNLRDATR